MAGKLLPVVNALQFLTSQGLVLNGGQIETYEAGTSTPVATYTDNALSVAHANPIVLNSFGQLPSPVWVEDGVTVKAIFKTSAGVQVGPTFDNLEGINDSSSLFLFYGGNAGGSADVITLTPAVTVSAYEEGQRFWFIAGATNTGPVTLNVNGLGALEILKRVNNSLDAGDIVNGGVVEVFYDGTQFQLMSSSGTAGAGDLDVDRFSGDGTTTDFTLSAAPVNSSLVFVFITGTYEQKDQYTISGTTISFDTAPPAGTDNIEVVYGVFIDPTTLQQSFIVAASDESTAITAATGKVSFEVPYAFTIESVTGFLSTAQASGSIFTVDINKNGSSILSTKLTIDNTEQTSRTAATPAVISDTSLAAGDIISIDVDQIGDSTAKGLKVSIIGTSA